MCGAREVGREGPPYDEREVQQYVGRGLAPRQTSREGPPYSNCLLPTDYGLLICLLTNAQRQVCG